MRGMHVLKLALAGLALLVGLGSCGKAANNGAFQIDSNTNWLKRCTASSECSGALICLCGQCTQPCAATDECSLLPGASCGLASCGDRTSSGGGQCVVTCEAANECPDDFACTEGQCTPLPDDVAGNSAPMDDMSSDSSDPLGEMLVPETCELRSMDMDEVFQAIGADTAQISALDRPYLRYLSLANRLNSGACEGALEVERAALSKTLNSLSSETSIEQPFAIDPNRVIFRVDLRDYGWDTTISVDGTEYEDAWEAVVANDPYAVPWSGDDADDAVLETGTNVPVLFANTFLAAATEARVYYSLLSIPPSVAELMLRLEVQPSDPSIRAAFSNSDRTFVADRWNTQIGAGYVWQMADFGRDRAALLANPLGVPAGDRELVLTLSNGMLAFVYVAASGARIERSNLFGALSTSHDLRSSFSRYASGVQVEGGLRGEILNELALGHLTASELQAVTERYIEAAALTELLNDDRSVYAGALERAQLEMSASDPITRSYAAFAAPVGMNTAAGELMITPEFLDQNLRELDASLQILEVGSVSRSDFTTQYLHALCTLSITLENAPDSELCDSVAP